VDGVLPMSLALSDGSARLIGAYVRRGLVDVVRPPLNRIEAHLGMLTNGLRMLSIDVIDVFNGITDRRLKVQVMNEELLDHLEATRWAVAYFSYNKFLELLDHIAYMRWLDGRSHLHLHQIIEGLAKIESLVAIFGTVFIGMGLITIGLLLAILDKLYQGIDLGGTIQIIVTGADPLANLDLWKLLGLLGLLALGLAIIVAFLFGVAAALRTFGAGAIVAAAAVGVLAAGLIPLINTLAKFKLGEMLMIAAGFLAITLFVAGLGKAFQLFKTDLEKVIPHLNTFFESIAKLMTTLSKFSVAEMLKIAGGFAAIALFVAGLGKAFQQFKTDLDKVVPQLDRFFTSIGNLMTTLARFKPGEMITIAVGFLAIAGFVWLLGKALGTLTKQAISAIDPLANFFTAITALMVAIARFSVGDMIQIALGFLAIAGFVWLLSLALNTLTAQSVAALPGLASLLGALASLATTLGNMSTGEMITMAIGLLLIAGFVWAIAAALVYAAGPLASLATLFEKFGSVLSVVSGIGSTLWGVLSDIGGVIGDIGGAIGDFFGEVGGFIGDVGGVIGDVGGAIGDAAGFVGGAIGDAAGFIGGAASDFFGGIGDSLFGSGETVPLGNLLATAVPPPAPAPPAAPASPAAPAGGLGALGPGGALAAAPVGGPTTVDQTVNAGGINVAINADRLEANSAQLLTDDIVAQLQSKLGALRSTQDFQAGARPAMA
jgi:hypothetical protein